VTAHWQSGQIHSNQFVLCGFTTLASWVHKARVTDLVTQNHHPHSTSLQSVPVMSLTALSAVTQHSDLSVPGHADRRRARARAEHHCSVVTVKRANGELSEVR
jgi:hypothetical protein